MYIVMAHHVFWFMFVLINKYAENMDGFLTFHLTICLLEMLGIEPRATAPHKIQAYINYVQICQQVNLQNRELKLLTKLQTNVKRKKDISVEGKEIL